MDAAVTQARARRAAHLRYGNTEAADAALADLQAARLAEHVAKLVADAPPLTPEQRTRLAVLLLGGGA